MKTFLQAPYHDDYDENKKFHRILSRPSYPVQARELTQSQTMLQHQIKRFGDHFFAEGAQVVDGQVTFDTSIQYVRLRSITGVSGSSALTVSQFVGQQVYGTTSKVKAVIIAASEAEGSDPATLFVKYVASSANNGYDKFIKNEGLSLGEGYQVENSDTATGTGSIAQVARGYFYALGMFCLVDAQTIVLDKYSSAPSYRIGLGVKEDIVTPEDDSSLADNAQGSYNFSAPGAHRYRVELILKKVPLTSVDNDNFIELGQIQNGRILKQTTKTEYSDIEETLARRTHDESGDYTVRPFKLSIREHRSNDRGEWKNSRSYLRGDIVRNDGNTYVARTTGTSLALGTGPTHIVGSRYESTEGGGVCWEYTENPVFNNGVYPAEGRLSSLEIVDGGKGYIAPPSVSILGGNNDATAEAVVSDGKVVKLILTNGGSGFVNNNITVVFSGGISGGSDSTVATAVAKAEFGKEDFLAIGLEGGKAYVQGFEVEKVGTTYIEVPKARTYEQVTDVHINSNVGNFVYVTNLYGLPPFGSSGSTIGTIDLYDGMGNPTINGNSITIPTTHGKKIGTARVRGIEWDSGVRSSVKSVYKLYIYDVKFDDPKKDFVRDVKSFRSGNEFFCNIEQVLTRIDGFVTYKDATTLTGSMTSFMTDVSVGDWLNLNGEYCRVTAVNGQNELKVADGSVNFNADKIDGAPIRIIRTNIVDSHYNTALYKIPSDVVRSIKNSLNTYDIEYRTMEKFSGDYVTVSPTDRKQVTVSVPSSVGGYFDSALDTDNYIVVETKSDKTVVIHEVGGGTESGKSTITLTLNSDGISVGSSVMVMGTLIKSGIKNVTPKTKTLKQEVIGDKAYKVLTPNEYKASVIPLKHADVYRIISVKMLGNDGEYSIDITDRYDLDDGQTENYYGISKLVLKPTYLPASAPIAVSYEYFEHGVGDYFCVDSYPEEIDYSEIKMRDYLDFRPTLDKDGNVVKSSASLKRGTQITTSYSYYIPRCDKISVDFTGNLVNIEGVPSTNPQLPETPSLAMNLYNLSIAPYTFGADSSNVIVETIDNRRYTMRDIGKLEKRISNLEEYTTLSLLEQSTSSMSIEDSYGLERFKRGFVVDNFKDTTLLNTKDNSTFCAMDIEEGCVRPPFIQQNVSLVEKVVNNGDRVGKNYMAYGKVFTLALDDNEKHVVLVEQGLASRTENINPFAVATFFGKIDINPSSDDWFETKYLPEIVNQVEGNYLQTKSSLEGTVWGSWQTTWTGKANETSKTFSNWSYINSSWRNVDITRSYTQDSTERRTGIKTTVTSKIDYEEVDDRVVSTSEIPYMRSRYLLVKARGLKPYTRFYPYFDNVDIDYWCTPCSAIKYESLSDTEFDCDSSAGSDYLNKARVIETTKNSYWAEETDKTCLDIGDVITSSRSSSDTGTDRVENLTAVVVGKSIDGETGEKYLYVANIKKEGGAPLDGRASPTSSAKTFARDDIIIGSLSGARGKILEAQPNLSHINDPLVTNHAGELYFLYWIPDGDRVDYNTTGAKNTSASLQFRTGDRVLSLTDADSKGVLPTSSAESVYSATGLLTTRQKTTNAVRNAVITRENLSQDRTVTNTWSTTTRETMYVDPLAQTFMVDCKGGCFLSKVDIFFASKDANLPVKLQIRTVENGYPSSKVLAFGEVVKNPSDVHLSIESNQNNTVTYQNDSGVTITESDYNTPTTFEFESPVYVEDKTEYCIVLMSDSTKYRVWIAGIGDTVPGSNMVISKQPYNGVLFKSQNASTWTADQTQDLKFRLYRANFKTNVIGDIQFKANTPSMVYLEENSIQTKKGSNKIRIWQPHHGMFEGASTRIVYDNMNDIDAKVYATGTLDKASGNSRKTVKGINTKFTTECDVGSTIYIETASQSSETILVGVVEEIISDTELTLTTDSPEYESASKFYIRKSFNGIPFISVCKLHNGKVKNVDSESFVIELDDGFLATESGYCGDSNLKISRNLNYDIIQPSVTSQTFSETSIGYIVEGVYGHNVDSDIYQEGKVPNFSVTVNDNNFLPYPMCVYSEENKSSLSDDLVLNVKFESKNPSLSPIIDGDRVSALLVNNIINDPTQANTNVAGLDNEDITFEGDESYTLTGGIVGFKNLVGGSGYTSKTLEVTATGNLVTEKAEVQAVVENGEVTDIIILNSGSGYINDGKSMTVAFKKSDGGASGFSAVPVIAHNQIVVDNSSPVADISIGKQITVLGHTVTVIDKGVLTKDDKPIKTILYIDKEWSSSEIGTHSNAINVHTLFVEEIAPIGGSCVAKYITKEISLDGLCDYLRVAYSANCPFDSDIDVYCKSYIGSSGDESYDNTPWVKMESTAPITKVGVNEETFYDVSYSKEGMKAFDRLAVKLVFRGKNSSTVPRVRDLRIIACA